MYFRPMFLVMAVLLISGCMIKGVKNTNSYRELPKNGSYILVMDAGEEITGSRIGKMIDFQMQELGLKPAASSDSADVVVRWAFDVTKVGTTSTAFTSIQPGRSTANIVGNTAYIKTKPSTATTHVTTNDDFQKTIAIKMFDKSNEKIWEGKVTEVGWCNQIFVTAPHILGLLFDKFPQEAINVREAVSDDPRTNKFKNLFPADTNWGCR